MAENETEQKEAKIVRDGGLLQIVTSLAAFIGAISAIAIAGNQVADKGPDFINKLPDWEFKAVFFAVGILTTSIVIEVFRYAMFGGKFSIIKTVSQSALACILYQWYNVIHFQNNLQKGIFIAIAIAFFMAWDKADQRLNAEK
jgi:hypothetical protein